MDLSKIKKVIDHDFPAFGEKAS